MCKRTTFLVSLVVVSCWVVNAPADLVARWDFEGDFGDALGTGTVTT
jgi:hypothetical protein